MKKTLLATSILAIALTAPLAHAYKAGDIIVRAGAVTVAPNEDSSNVQAGANKVPGTKATLDSNT